MIKVLHAGMYNTVQDQGRFGYAKMGVPVSGALDAYSAELAKALLQCHQSDAVIEITFGQGRFQFTEPTLFCLTGGDFSPRLDDVTIEMNRPYQTKAGAILSFGKRKYGARTYLAVKGGIQSESVLNSQSFSKGITPIRLEKGDALSIGEHTEFPKKKHASIRIKEEHFNSGGLTAFHGPEFDRLNAEQKHRLSRPFTISTDNNRVGYLLNERVENDLNPILTSAVLPGTVQLTPSGKLIILMKDCQVSGGYPRVLQLSQYAISRLSQRVAGEEVEFTIE